MDWQAEILSLRQAVEKLQAEVASLKQQIVQLTENNLQPIVTIDTTKLHQFHERVKSILRTIPKDITTAQKGQRSKSQNDLASALFMDPGDLSKRFTGRLQFKGSEIKQIVTQLIKWGGIQHRETAQELLALMNVEDFSPAVWKDIAQESLELHLEYEPYSLTALRNMLQTRQLEELVQEVGQGKFEHSLLEMFIRNRAEPPGLRQMVFELYLRSNPSMQRSSQIATELLSDFDPSTRKLAVQQIKEYKLSISDEALSNILNDSAQDVVLHAVKLAATLLEQKKVQPQILAHPNVIQHRYWLIRRLAIDAIANDDPNFDKADTVKLLCQFKGVTFWASRKRIIEYFRVRYCKGYLQGDDYDSVIQVLEKYATDGKSSKENTERAQQTLAVLKNELPCPQTS